MSQAPKIANRFEFVVTAGARARQLLAGSTPRVDAVGHKKTTVAREEVLTRAVQKVEPTSTTSES
ncbi:MAG: DNA-directed RNA polymerase subunit omega [Vicinamibacterales bacterium]